MLSTCLVENDQDPQDPPGQAASRGFQQRIDAGNAAAMALCFTVRTRLRWPPPQLTVQWDQSCGVCD